MLLWRTPGGAAPCADLLLCCVSRGRTPRRQGLIYVVAPSGINLVCRFQAIYQRLFTALLALSMWRLTVACERCSFSAISFWVSLSPYFILRHFCCRGVSSFLLFAAKRCKVPAARLLGRSSRRRNYRRGFCNIFQLSPASFSSSL